MADRPDVPPDRGVQDAIDLIDIQTRSNGLVQVVRNLLGERLRAAGVADDGHILIDVVRPEHADDISVESAAQAAGLTGYVHIRPVAD